MGRWTGILGVGYYYNAMSQKHIERFANTIKNDIGQGRWNAFF